MVHPLVRRVHVKFFFLCLTRAIRACGASGPVVFGCGSMTAMAKAVCCAHTPLAFIGSIYILLLPWWMDEWTNQSTQRWDWKKTNCLDKFDKPNTNNKWLCLYLLDLSFCSGLKWFYVCNCNCVCFLVCCFLFSCLTYVHCGWTEDSINELVHIRDSVHMMKNSSPHNRHYNCSNLLYQAVSDSP